MRAAARVLAMAACLVAGCARAPVPVATAPDVRTEIRRLEAEVAAVDAERAGRPALHLALARLYVDPANPAPDYRAALAELRFFAALDRRGGASPDVRRWINALEALERLAADRDRLKARVEELAKGSVQARGVTEALQRENQELKRAADGQAKEAAGLRDAVKNLTRENQELKDQIERLKELDRQLEHLRRTVR